MSSDPFAGTATDNLRIHTLASLNPGPRLLVLGGVHGDETCGTAGIERVLAELDGGTFRLRRGEGMDAQVVGGGSSGGKRIGGHPGDYCGGLPLRAKTLLVS